MVEPVSQGCTNKEIAEALHLAPHTVENYVSELMAIWNCANRLRLVVRAQGYNTLQENKESTP